jgi:lysophospholipase L1-like esterase
MKRALALIVTLLLAPLAALHAADPAPKQRPNIPVEGGVFRGAAVSEDSTKASKFQPVKMAPLRIMPLGDSITVGFTDNPAWSHPFEFGYRSGLYKRLKEAGHDFTFVGSSKEPFTNPKRFGDPTHGGMVSPVLDLRPLNQNGHHGHGGFSIEGLRGHVAKWITREQPDIILLLIGINGISAESPRKLDSLVQTIFDARKEVALIVAQIPPSSRFNQHILSYNSHIREKLVPTFSAEGHAISTVDQYTHFLTKQEDPQSIDAARLSNGRNHPTNQLYEKMAESWFQGIESLLKRGLPGR